MAAPIVNQEVAGSQLVADCTDEKHYFGPSGWAQNYYYESGCTVEHGTFWVDADSCRGTVTYDSYYTSDSACRSGTKKASYVCWSYGRSPMQSGPPTVVERRRCEIHSGTVTSTCDDDYHGGGMGSYTRQDSCDASIGIPKAAIEAECTRADSYGYVGGQWVSSSSETCEALVVTPASTTRCTFVPAVGILYLYHYVVDGNTTGSALGAGAGAPTCRRR